MAKFSMISLIFILMSAIAIAQTVTITGTVRSSSDSSFLVGVSVSEQGTPNGTITDDSGGFSLVVNKNALLAFSLIGYPTQEIRIAEKRKLSIYLGNSEGSSLEEVVVTALGVKRQEKALGYATQRISGSGVQTVKGIDVATSLTGQVAGLVVTNPTNFYATPGIELRGESALLVIDGVMASPVGNIRLRDIPADIIESIDILKGPTASALYGAHAPGGVILVTTKKAKSKKLTIDINSNTMFQTGFLAIPKIQTSYGHGTFGKIDDDYVWGPKLDIGDSAIQWNPVSKKNEMMPLVSSGKNNLKTFLQTGMVTNNSVTFSQGSEQASFRTTFNHVHNIGQFPNQKLNIYSISVSGSIKSKDKFIMEANMSYNKKTAPQIWGNGYQNQGYLYQLIMWTGPDYDLNLYRDYWVTPYSKQNWLYSNWYDNPYLIAFEKLNGVEENVFNTNCTITYKVSNFLKLMVRPGFDLYANTETHKNPAANIFSTRGGWSAKGKYAIAKRTGWSSNSDAILSYSRKVSDLTIDALAGGALSYYFDEALAASTNNGLSAPTFYSLNGSIDPPTVNLSHGAKQTNSWYARISLGWQNAIFFEATGRKDWISTQPKVTRSFFYPSFGSSVVISDLLQMPAAINMLKLRGSWALFKTPASVYATNRLYSVSNGAWTTSETFNTASYPSSLLGSPNILPTSTSTWEVGMAAYAFKKRVRLDVAYFNKYYYNRQINQSVPLSSGFSSTIINTGETYVRRGFEITLGGDIISNKFFKWASTINWSNQHRYYKELDSVYSAVSPWVKPGIRLDVHLGEYWEKTAAGEQIFVNGMPQLSKYKTKYGYGDPDFSLGFINTFTIGAFIVTLNVDGRFGGLMYNYIYDKQWDAGSNPQSNNQYRYDAVVNGKKYIGKGVKITEGTVAYDNFGNITSDTRKYAPNDVEAEYQRFAQSYRGGDRGIQSKSFFKVRELSIGYAIPANAVAKLGFTNTTISLTAQNLFLWTRFTNGDPDVNAEDLNSPSQRIIGVNLKFGL